MLPTAVPGGRRGRLPRPAVRAARGGGDRGRPGTRRKLGARARPVAAWLPRARRAWSMPATRNRPRGYTPRSGTRPAHGPVDLAMICVPARACAAALAEAAAAGARAAIIYGGGFARGRSRRYGLSARARRGRGGHRHPAARAEHLRLPRPGPRADGQLRPRRRRGAGRPGRRGRRERRRQPRARLPPDRVRARGQPRGRAGQRRRHHRPRTCSTTSPGQPETRAVALQSSPSRTGRRLGRRRSPGSCPPRPVVALVVGRNEVVRVRRVAHRCPRHVLAAPPGPRPGASGGRCWSTTNAELVDAVAAAVR
jgi:hypothetical protein